MNVPYPIPGQQGDIAAFVADSTFKLGSLVKPVNAGPLISVDYSQAIDGTILTSSFRVKPGGMPAMAVYDAEIADPATSLIFWVWGGIAGRSYEVTVVIVVSDGEVRSDLLTVHVPDDGGNCVMVTPGYPPAMGAVSGDGSIIVNTAPRFFLSTTPPVGANIMDWWYNNVTQQLFQNITNGAISSWQNIAVDTGDEGITDAPADGNTYGRNDNSWVVVTGGGGGGGGTNIITLQPITPNGTATAFTLTASGITVDVTATNTLFVSVDGVWQQPSAQYTAVGNTITFSQAPTADAVIFMLWFAPT
jgi:hypothetical protein